VFTPLVTALEVIVAPVIAWISDPTVSSFSEERPLNCAAKEGSSFALEPRPGVSV